MRTFVNRAYLYVCLDVRMFVGPYVYIVSMYACMFVYVEFHILFIELGNVNCCRSRLQVASDSIIMIYKGTSKQRGVFNTAVTWRALWMVLVKVAEAGIKI